MAATVLSFAWFCSRLSPGLASIPWHGALLGDPPLYDLPVLTWATARTVTYLSPDFSGWLLNAISAGFGALICGLVAGFAATKLRSTRSPLLPSVCAVLGALFVAASAPVVQASTAAGPATLTVFLGLGSALLLASTHASRHRNAWASVAALLAGLSASNHASFGLLIVVFVSIALLPGAAFQPRLFQLAPALLAFLVGASGPWFRAWMSGESLSSFLHHALNTPHPIIGNGWPDRGYARTLSASLSYPALSLALLGMVYLLRRPPRVHGMVCLLIFTCFGPLLPALTNHRGAAYGLQDHLAPKILVVAALGICIASALAGLSAALTGRRLIVRQIANVTGLVLVVCAVAYQASETPNRRHPYATILARDVLDACPQDSFLVCANAELSSFLSGAQRIDRVRTDIQIFSTDAMLDWRLRRKLALSLREKSIFDPVFDPESRLEEYSIEQPFLIRELSKRSGAKSSGPELTSLAIWDFVRSNATRNAVCFAGLSNPWLSARAQPQGAVLMYPRAPSDHTKAPSPDFDSLCEQTLRCNDPDLARLLQQIVLSLSDAARSRGDGAQARDLAQLALHLNQPATDAYFALARAEARQGRREQAVEYAKSCQDSCDDIKTIQLLLDAIKDDSDTYDLENRFTHTLSQETSTGARPQDRSVTAGLLWQAGQLDVLRHGYESILAQAPDEGDALYELAAIQAQLGEFARAKELLHRWSRVARLSDEALTMRMNLDGRFALIYLPEREQDIEYWKTLVQTSGPGLSR
ncbi:MAG: tetratricopeptide repeat protein [Candidatus Hydrogenedentes bacterium]|nr:tetratricopeptide repeat protein [Candidatus Hydrogenedentota bacterium]